MLKFHSFPDFLQTELDARKNSDWHKTPRSPWFRITSNAVKKENVQQQEAEMTKKEYEEQNFRNSLMAPNDIVSSENEFSNSLPMATSAKVSKDAPNRYLAGPYHNSENNPSIIQSYYDGTDHYRPRPGVESVSVSMQGDSTTASFTWKCWTPSQLNILTPMFLWPGMSIIVEYGWSDMDVEPLNISSFEARKEVFRKKPRNAERYVITEADVKPGVSELHPIVEKIRKGKGKYGILGGVISDFDISYNEQGGYDCQTTIQEINEGFLGLLSKRQVTRRNSTKGKGKKKHTLYEYISGGSSNTDGQSFDEDLSNSESDIYNNLVKISDETYIPWGAFENKILNKYIGYDSEGGPGAPGSQPIMKFDSRDTIVKNYPGLLTTNDEVCVITSKTLNIGPKVLFERLSEHKNFNKYADGASNQDYIGREDRKKNGYLYNIYINTKLIKEKITEDTYVYTAIENILNAASAACLNIWDFKIAEEGGMLKIIDQNALGRVEKQTPYVFQPFTNKSVTNSMSVSLNMDDQMKTMMWLGSRLDKNVGGNSSEKNHVPNSDSDAFKQMFKGYVDPVYQQLRRSAPEKDEIRESSKIKTLTDLEAQQQFRKAYKKSSSSEAEEEALSYISLSEDQRKEIQERMYNDSDSPVNSDRAMPVDCSFELPGIAGFQKFQVFDVANLPEILSSGLFQVSDINHEITSTDWSTSVNAKFYIGNSFKQSN